MRCPRVGRVAFGPILAFSTTVARLRNEHQQEVTNARSLKSYPTSVEKHPPPRLEERNDVA